MLPFEAGPINDALWWHPIHAYDSGHQWFRSLVREAAEQIGAEADG
ncbi:hypothetical protein [Nocardia amamiensis]